MRLVLGLGNPGERYAATRHNVAWRVLDALVAKWPGVASERGTSYESRRVRLPIEELELLKPLTFMNLSGEALDDWRRGRTWDDGQLLVISDDVYLPVGVLRLRRSGSSGGHRGLESLESALGHREFARLRVGVGAAEDAAALREHVLETFSAAEETVMKEVVARAREIVEVWATDGITVAMNRFNRRVGQEGSES
ncbi:MAG: aminoacyl-tRNA hydrolase [Candidatus Eisenbacteria bacterium]|uniref:Peptidyl-tRNA hydrolase n=1 Tax=Eiseniibacteriota bacterium TaxID=2212470 RepID=A0A849SHL1_UNCEI|nr:aminoacyl-tRNA hydrolase [Candidatus Eisenbacteria bacterium]